MVTPSPTVSPGSVALPGQCGASVVPEECPGDGKMIIVQYLDDLMAGGVKVSGNVARTEIYK